jgi:hypothetical protein
MQTGDRIGYHPDTARVEMAAFAAKYRAALEAVVQMRENAGDVKEAEWIRRLPSEMPAESRTQRLERYHAALTRAVAELEGGSAH